MIKGSRKGSNQRWIVLIASALAILCAGSLFAWSAFATQEAAYLSEITKAEINNLSIVFTIANAVAPIAMIAGGFLSRKINLKIIVLAGGILLGTGLFLCAGAKSVPALTVAFTLGPGLGGNMLYGVLISNITRFFPDRSGFAGGLIVACFGSGAILLPPLITAITSAHHITYTFRVLGIAMGLIVCLSALFIIPCPAGFWAEGEKVREAADWKPLDMIKTGDFYLMFLVFLSGAVSGMMVLSQASQISQGMMGFSVEKAAFMVSLVALFNTLARIVSGTLSDKLGATGTLRVTFAISLAANVLLFFTKEGSDVIYYICLALIGFGYGSLMGIYPGFTQNRFGKKYHGVNYGIMFIALALAGYIGPMVTRVIQGMFGRFQPMFLVSAGLIFVGEILIVVLRKKER